MMIDKKFWTQANYPHMRLPKGVLSYDLSPEAKLLYAALLDRTNLSFANKKFRTETGGVYVYFPLTEIQWLLRCGHDKATSALRELIRAKLVKVQRTGVGRPYRVELIPRDWAREYRAGSAAQSHRVCGESECPECEKTAGNNTDVKTDMIFPEIAVRRAICSMIDRDCLVNHFDVRNVDRLLDLVAEYLALESGTIRIGMEDIPIKEVQRSLHKITRADAEAVLRRLSRVRLAKEYTDLYILTLLIQQINERCTEEGNSCEPDRIRCHAYTTAEQADTGGDKP